MRCHRTPAAAVAAALKEIAFDRRQCWRVRDLALAREDIKLYLADGFVMLLQTARQAARWPPLFWAEVEAAMAKSSSFPPPPGERQSLVRFTESPNLNEHFKSAVLIFTDGTAAEIEEFLRTAPPSRRRKWARCSPNSSAPPCAI